MRKVKPESLRLHSNSVAELRRSAQVFLVPNLKTLPLYIICDCTLPLDGKFHRDKSKFSLLSNKLSHWAWNWWWLCILPLILSRFFTYLLVTFSYLRNHSKKALWTEHWFKNIGLCYNWHSSESPLYHQGRPISTCFIEMLWGWNAAIPERTVYGILWREGTSVYY